MKDSHFAQWIFVAAAVLFAAAPLLADDGSMNGSSTSGPSMQGPSMQGPAMTGDSSRSPGDASSMMQDNNMQQGDSMMSDSSVGNRLRYAPSAAHKVIFTNLQTAEAFARKGPTVLFFAADWCPTCQAALRDINQNGAKLASDITIVLVNYDKAKDLEAKYGITTQHSFVQIDPMGNKVAIWNGGGVDTINSRVVRK